MKYKRVGSLRLTLVSYLAATALLPLLSLGLVAEELPSPQMVDDAILPIIPVPEDESLLASGPLRRITGPIPSLPAPDPDEFKSLYGYYGPFYNVSNLDDNVVILEKTLFLWPTSTWKITGLLRNQARTSVRIRSVIARLLGSRGELLETTTATVFVDELRAGEPSPFRVEASLPSENVSTIEWQIEQEPIDSVLRKFELYVYSNEPADEYGYYLFGGIRNAGESASQVRVAAAWLDDTDRVLYVDLLPISLGVSGSEPQKTSDAAILKAEAIEYFTFRVDKPELASALGNAKLALWGISK